MKKDVIGRYGRVVRGALFLGALFVISIFLILQKDVVEAAPPVQQAGCDVRAQSDPSIVLITEQDILSGGLYYITVGGNFLTNKIYCLTENVSLPNSYPPIVVDANYVTIDLNGKRITGNNSVATSFILNGSQFQHDLVVFGNGAKLDGVGYVVQLSGTSSNHLRDVSVTGLKIANSPIALRLGNIDNIVIEENEIANARDGISIGGIEGYLKITNNIISFNPVGPSIDAGIAISGGSKVVNVEITDNHITYLKNTADLKANASGIVIYNMNKVGPGSEFNIADNIIENVYRQNISFQNNFSEFPVLSGIAIGEMGESATVSLSRNIVGGLADKYKRPTITGVPLSNDFVGISVFSASNQIDNNEIYGNFQNGVRVYNSAYTSGSVYNSVCIPFSPFDDVDDQGGHNFVGTYNPSYCKAEIE